MREGHRTRHPAGGRGYRRQAGVLLAGASLLSDTLTAPFPAGAAEAGGARPGATGAAPFVDEQVLYGQGEFGYACFRIPAAVRAANGMVLAFAEGRVDDCGDDGDIDLVLRRSADGGLTWGPLQVVVQGDSLTRGNPVPIADERTGRVVVVGTSNGPAPCPNGCDRDPYLVTSDDNGCDLVAGTGADRGQAPGVELLVRHRTYARHPA